MKSDREFQDQDQNSQNYITRINKNQQNDKRNKSNDRRSKSPPARNQNLKNNELKNDYLSKKNFLSDRDNQKRTSIKSNENQKGGTKRFQEIQKIVSKKKNNEVESNNLLSVTADSSNNLQSAQNNQNQRNIDSQLHAFSKAPWDEVFPFLKYFKKDDQFSNEILQVNEQEPNIQRKKSLMQQAQSFLNINIQPKDKRKLLAQVKSDLELQENYKNKKNDVKYNEHKLQSILQNQLQASLGIGIITYHEQLFQLCVLFIALFIINMPLMYIYHSFDYFQSDGISKSFSMTLGNLGFSESHCKIQSLAQSNTVNLKCASSSSKIYWASDFGFTTIFENQMTCTHQDQLFYCQQFFHQYNFREYFQQECVGKSQCQINRIYEFLEKIEDQNNLEICKNIQSRFFIQYQCKEPQKLIDQKKFYSCIIASLQITGSMLTLFVLIYNRFYSKKLDIESQSQTLKASDYTLYIDINAVHRLEFEYMFKDKLYINIDGSIQNVMQTSRGILFKQYIMNKLQIPGANILRIDLVFDNEKMIRLLEQRGNAIMLQNIQMIQEIEEQIEYQKRYHYLTDIVGAFITYETSDDVERVKQLLQRDKKNKLNFVTDHIFVEENSDSVDDRILDFAIQIPVNPCDIKWKNMQIKKPERMVRTLLICLALGSLIYISFLFHVSLSSWKFENIKFEKDECKLSQYKDLIDYQNEAFSAWSNAYVDGQWRQDILDKQDIKFEWFNSTKKQTIQQINSTLSCFCDSEIQKNGFLSTFFKQYEFKYHDEREKRYSNQKFGRLGNQTICQTYLLSNLISQNFAFFQTFFIFAPFNWLYIVAVEPLIQMIGMNYATNERRWTSIAIFVCLIINSCVVPILLSADFSVDYPGSVWDFAFSQGGRNSDFSSTWYLDMEQQLTSAIMILALQPLYNLIGEMIYDKFMKYIKNNLLYINHQNNFDDNIKFFELFVGPEYHLQLKSAPTNACIFICVTFGLAFPYFYPLTLFAIALQYLVERYSIAFFYRQPQKLSSELPDSNISILLLSPLFQCAIAFWMMGNSAMFSVQQVEAIQNINQTTVKSNHTLGETIMRIFKFKLSAAETMFLIAFIAFFVFIMLINTVQKIRNFFNRTNSKMNQFPKSFQEESERNHENEYLCGLKEQDLRDLIEEEKILMTTFDVQSMKSQNLQRAEAELKKRYQKMNYKFQTKPQKYISDDPYYQVHKNFEFWLKFNSQTTREEINTMLLLCLPLIPPYLHKKVYLNHYQRSLKKLRKNESQEFKSA